MTKISKERAEDYAHARKLARGELRHEPCDCDACAETLRLRGLLEETLEDLEYMREEGDTDLRTPIHRIRQALHREEGE